MDLSSSVNEWFCFFIGLPCMEIIQHRPQKIGHSNKSCKVFDFSRGLFTAKRCTTCALGVEGNEILQKRV